MSVVVQGRRVRHRLVSASWRSITRVTGSRAFGLRVGCLVGTSPVTEEVVIEWPIEHDGESVVLEPRYMEVDEAYSFRFLGHHLLAVKRADESIDFYYLPTDS